MGVTAFDIFALLCSFLPNNGKLLRVSIYPSDYGLTEIKEEFVNGICPTIEFEQIESKSKNTFETHKEYLNIDNYIVSKEPMADKNTKSMWYYAIAEFDNDITANVVYMACNGFGFVKSDHSFNLRFVSVYENFSNCLIKDTTINIQNLNTK